MTRAIKIDLKTALTDETLAQALPHRGACAYAAPCIIGAMIPASRRKRLDNLRQRLKSADDNYIPVTPSIRVLVQEGFVAFVDDRQVELATELQDAFDHGTRRDFDRKVRDIRKELATA